MAINFEITGDNKQFLDAMRKVQESVRQTSKTVSDALTGQARIVEDLTRKTEQLAAEIAEAEKSGGSGIDQKKKEYEELSERLQEAKQDFISLQREFGKQSGTATQDQATDSLKTRLRQLTQQIAELTLEYRNMSASEQQSAKGQELIQKIDTLTREAGTLRDAMDDVNRSVRGMASDTRAFDALAGGINVVTSTAGAATSVFQMFGASQEELVEIQTKLQATLAISNALSVIQNNLQKESNLMIGINTLQEKANNAAKAIKIATEGKGVIATKAAIVAQKAFNAVAKANPYVLLAGAILTVVGAFAAFASGSKKASEAEKKRNEELEKAKRLAEERAYAEKKMAEGISQAASQQLASYYLLQRKWKECNNDVKKQEKFMSEYRKELDNTGFAIYNLTDAETFFVAKTDDVVNAIIARARAQASYELMVDKIKQGLERINEKSIKSGAYYEVAKGIHDLSEEEKELARGKGWTKWAWDGGQSSNEYLSEEGLRQINLRRNARAGQRNRKWQADAEEDVKNSVKNLTDAYIDATNDSIRYAANTGLKQIKGGSGGGSTNKRGSGGGSTWNQSQADADAKRLLDEWKASLTAMLRDVNQDIADANVEFLDESTNKVLKKLDEDEKKELAAIQQQREDLIKQRKELDISLWEKSAEGHDKYNYQEKSDAQYLAMVSADNPEVLEAISKREEQIRKNAQKRREEIFLQEAASMREYLKEYGSIEQQRLSITEEYEEKIAKAMNEGERLAAKAAMDAALAEFDRKQADVNWESIFGNLTAYTSKELAGFKEQLRKTLSEGNMDVDQYKAIVERIEEINTAILSAQREENSFLGMSLQGGEERKRLTMEETEARKQAAKAAERQLKAEAALNIAKMDVRSILSSSGVNYSGAINTANSQNILNAAAKQMKGGADSEAYKRLQAALLSLSGTEIEYQKARKVSVSAEQNHANALKKLNTFLGDWKKKLADLMPLFEQLTANISSLPDLAKTLGFDENSGVGKAAAGIADTANNAMGAVSDYMSGNYVGAAAKGISAITSLGETLGAWSNSNRAEVEKENNRLSLAMDVNTEAVNRLTEAMKAQSPVEAYRSFEQAVAAFESSEQAARQIMENNAYMYDGGHSLNYDLGGAGGTIKAIFDYLHLTPDGDYDLGGLLRTLSAEQWNALYEDERGRMLLKQLGVKISEAEDDGNYNGIFKDILDFANAYSKDAKDKLRQTFQEAVTGVSFDGFKDNFKSALMDMEKSVHDFGRDFTEELMQSVLNARIEELYGERMQALYDSWEKALSGDNVLTEDEVRALQDRQTALVNDMMKTRNELARLTGYDAYGSEESATFKSASSFTQEQGDILNGRLTAIQMGVAVNNTLGKQMAASLKSMEQTASVSAETNTAVVEIRNMMIISNSFLEDIAKYSKKQYDDFGAQIDRIATKVNSL